METVGQVTIESMRETLHRIGSAVAFVFCIALIENLEAVVGERCRLTIANFESKR